MATEQKSANQKPLHKETVEWLLRMVLRLPLIWLVLMIIFTFLSVFHIAWQPPSGLSVTFQVEGTTALFLALIWLPALLRVFALVGGGIKTPAGEFTSAGLGTLAQVLDPDTLGTLIERTAAAEEKAPQDVRIEAQQARQELQQAYAARIPANQTRRVIAELIQRFKSVLKGMAAGAERTNLLESVLGQMRALAAEAGFSSEEINAYLRSDDEGQRIFGLAAVESLGDARQFDGVLAMIDNPKSAFEQYHALRAMEQMAPRLNSTQMLKVKAVIDRQRMYDPAKKQWIEPGGERYQVSERLLAALR